MVFPIYHPWIMEKYLESFLGGVFLGKKYNYCHPTSSSSYWEKCTYEKEPNTWKTHGAWLTLLIIK
jgi:hypothetical protein